MVKIEILSDVMISGGPALAGSFIEVSQSDANLLVGMNKARLIGDAEAAQEPELEPEKDPESATEEAPKRGRKSAPSTEA